MIIFLTFGVFHPISCGHELGLNCIGVAIQTCFSWVVRSIHSVLCAFGRSRARLGTSDALLSRQETWVPSCPKWAGPACHLFSWEGREDSRYLWSPADMQPLKTGREEIQPLKIFVRVSHQIPRNLYMPLDWHPLPWKRQKQSVDRKIPISPFLLLSGPPNFRFGAESTKLKRWHTVAPISIYINILWSPWSQVFSLAQT